ASSAAGRRRACWTTTTDGSSWSIPTPCKSARRGRPRSGAPAVRRYVKTSFVFLVAGLLIGVYMITAQFVLDAYPPRLFTTAHAHLLLVGFMLMMVMGVATWMFPRPARAETRSRP